MGESAVIHPGSRCEAMHEGAALGIKAVPWRLEMSEVEAIE
jgi:hypothetical protein